MGADLYIMKLEGDAGYYRDSYNDYNLLWLLGLDYWVWFKKFLDKNGALTPAKAKIVLDEIEKRKFILERFAGSEKYEGMLKPDWAKHFNSKFAELTAFLRKAIELKSKIDASI